MRVRSTSGQNIKTAAKRRVTDAIGSIRAPPGKRIKRTAAKATFTAVKRRRRKKRTSPKRTADIFDTDDKDGVRA